MGDPFRLSLVPPVSTTLCPQSPPCRLRRSTLRPSLCLVGGSDAEEAGQVSGRSGDRGADADKSFRGGGPSPDDGTDESAKNDDAGELG